MQPLVDSVANPLKAKVRFEMGRSADLRQEVLDMLERQFRYVMGLCDPLENGSGKAIHEIRRSFKKNRALLRLIRDPLGYGSYYRENRAIRDMHRLLSPARDSDVFLNLIKSLKKTYPRLAEQTWYGEVLEKSRMQRNQEREKMLGGDITQKIRKGTRLFLLRMNHFRLKDSDYLLVSDGLSRMYRQGKSGLEEAFHMKADARVLHDFRKRAKYLQYQLTFLRPLFPEILTATSKTLQSLTDTLGVCNDYYHAREILPQMVSRDRAARRELDVLILALGEDLNRFRSETEKLARSLYAEETSSFVSRLGSYWDSYVLKI